MAGITALIVSSIIASLAAAAGSVGTSIYAQNKQNESIDKSNELTRQINQSNNAFNAEQAQLQRDWEERMSNTEIQRRVADLKAAGLNPALAVTNGGASTPGAYAATSSGSPSMRAQDYSPMAQVAANLGHLVTSASNLVFLNRLTRSNPEIGKQLGIIQKSVNNSVTNANKVNSLADAYSKPWEFDQATGDLIRNVKLFR